MDDLEHPPPSTVFLVKDGVKGLAIKTSRMERVRVVMGGSGATTGGGVPVAHPERNKLKRNKPKRNKIDTILKAATCLWSNKQIVFSFCNFLVPAPLILALLTAVLYALSFLHKSTSWVIWFSFIPIILFLKKDKVKIRDVFLYGWLSGFGFFLLNLSWLRFVTTTGWIILAIFQGLFVSVWAVIVNRFSRSHQSALQRITAPPLAWIVVDWIRSQGAFGMEWGSPAYSQHDMLPVVQWASIFGPYGVSGLILLMNTLLAEGLLFTINGSNGSRHKGICVPTTWIAALIVLIMIWAGGGFLYYSAKEETEIAIKERTKQEEPKTITVGLIQPSMPQNEKWDPQNLERQMNQFYQMAKEAKEKGAELIIFPETAIPVTLISNSYVDLVLKSWAQTLQVHLFVGAVERKDNFEWNATFLINPKGEKEGKYHKQHLVPFGEYIPGPFKILRRYLKILDRVPEYKAGNNSTIFHTQGIPWSSLICFESTIPGLARKAVQDGARFLVVATNDAWFNTSSAPGTHARMGVFRAVENRVYLIQAANTGISTIITPKGNVKVSSKLFEKSVIVGTIRAETKEVAAQYDIKDDILKTSTDKYAAIKDTAVRDVTIKDVANESGKTIYVIFGDWLVFISMIVLFVLYLNNCFILKNANKK